MPLGSFHTTVRDWFRAELGEPTAPQIEGWSRIREGCHTLIAAPTGSGKTLAAFLWALDGLLREGDALPDETRVVYVSPLKALGNDVRKNLVQPLERLRELDATLPEIRVSVRTGDTPASERAAMRKTPPHVLVTTPESLYILLTSAGGRDMLRTARTVILDEIHAIAGDKRGAHLALSVERLDALAERTPQRIGLSATQKPVEDVARLLVGVDRPCSIVDIGHLRDLDLALEVPDSPLETVCSHETWDEILTRMATLIEAHRTTLVFVNTRKAAERCAARLAEKIGKDRVTSHHGSLSKDRRLDAEDRLKAGKLRALVATASLELGIDVGDVDLVIQAGVPASIAVFLQRVGRSGHALSKWPKGRLFPLTRDELVCGAALLHATGLGELDRTPQPPKPLDILVQHAVAACVEESWDATVLYDVLRRSWPFRDLTREEFDTAIALHHGDRLSLLHLDDVSGTLRATKRARLVALTAGGAIPDTGEYRVLLEPESTPIGSVDEDFAVEASAGDVFQLGNASWRILKVEPGTVRVADAAGAPPSLPFWFGEAPARTEELSAAVGRVRERGHDAAWLDTAIGLPDGATRQVVGYLEEGVAVLGAVPTPQRVVVERFFDESGGMQLVIHAPFGGRINRAWGLALRKKFCRGFGFELQAAANEDSIVLSLGPQHSFPLAEIFDYLHPDTTRDTLVQALLDSPMFATRWRWNATRALVLPRQTGSKRVPTPIQRMRADDLLAAAFPEVLACGENLPPGDLPVPWEHPLVRQTIEDCLTEAMDVDGAIEVLRAIRSGDIETVCVDTPKPSAFAQSILNAMPYAFLDDAPLEERRTQAVMARRTLDPKVADSIGALDEDAVERVREEAWPSIESREELHEVLGWIGFLTAEEIARGGWQAWADELHASGRATCEDARWFATGATRDPKRVLRGRMEAVGPVFAESLEGVPDAERLLRELEVDGVVLRCRLGGLEAWCDRRLLSRIHRYTLERLRREIRPVSAADYWRFLAAWQHAADGHRALGPRGVVQVVDRLAGFEIAAADWETSVLPSRVEDYRGDYLDQVTLTGEVAWGRLFGAASSSARTTPIAMFRREHLGGWLALSAMADARATEGGGPDRTAPSSYARAVLAVLERDGPSFTPELRARTGLLPEPFERGLVEGVGLGRVTCDSFGGLRRLLIPPSKRKGALRRAPLAPAGRWSVLRGAEIAVPAEFDATAFAADRLLERYGVVFRTMLARERIPVPWRELVRELRNRELAGTVRGGRFVQRFSGEQYALPDAVATMRRLRRERDASEGAPADVRLSATDPLNLTGILTPDERVPSNRKQSITIRG